MATEGLTPTRGFRIDIQALRGIAILAVLLFHAEPALFPAGYLGVDIFFVISGYLITGLLKKEIENGSFSFRTFYFRRAKRLLPAAYVTFAASAILSFLLLSARERLDFGKQLLGGLSFSTNFVLWRQIDYFNPVAHLKPLVHIWSLAIEEQFYLLLPAVMFFVPSRFWLRLTAFLCAVSAALCFALAPSAPSASFYLLHTRGWELALGCVGALCGVRLSGRLRAPLFWGGLTVLAITPLFPVSTVHPRWDALFVCVATLVILLCNHPISERNIMARGLASTGDFSYSLYLVHWPLIAFANNCWAGALPAGVRIALVGTALGLGYLLYRFVERPIWRGDLQLSGWSAGIIAACSVSLALAAIFVGWSRQPSADYAAIRRANVGFSSACQFARKLEPLPECRSSPEPRIMVWGDSFAMHIVPGVAATTDRGVIQATRSICGPLVNVAPFDNRGYSVEWAKGCMLFNESVLDYLARSPWVDTVVLASPFNQYAGASEGAQKFRLLQVRNGTYTANDVGVSPAVAAMKATVTRVRALGKRVVVVAPPPTDGSFDIGECLDRRASGLPVFGLRQAGCEISVPTYHRYRARVLDFLSRLPAEAGVEVFRFDPFLCSTESCKTELDGTFLYRDAGHLSYPGSELLGRRIGLSQRLLELAR